jgi:hypothetical protein
MPGVYGAAARKSEVRQRSAGKGKRKVQLSAAQPSLMNQSGWDLRESQQGSSTSAASSTAGGLSVLSFFKQQGAIEL